MFEDDRADERDMQDQNECQPEAGENAESERQSAVRLPREIAYDSGIDHCLLQGGAHSTSIEQIQKALAGEWETVIIARWEWEHLEFADSNGFRRLWSHSPGMLEGLVQGATMGHDVQWSAEHELLKLEIGDLAYFVGLSEGPITPCERPVEPSESAGAA